MMYREWNRVWTTVALVGLLPGLCLPIVVTPVHAHSDWAAPFMGGMMAGHVLSNVAALRNGHRPKHCRAWPTDEAAGRCPIDNR